MDFKEELNNLIKKEICQDILNKIEIPKEKKFGDYSLPCFFLSKIYKKNPHQIAAELRQKITLNKYFSKIEAVGPYINFYINEKVLAKQTLNQILKEKENFGNRKEKKKIIIEFPSPNTNKPLHLGHLRNIFLGESISRILEKNGNKIIKANLNNDRGIHICQAMLAYQKYGRNKNPNKKSDHFVGDFYVLYNKKLKENFDLENQSQEMLKLWEKGDKKTKNLWKKINGWAIKGFEETYRNIGVNFDKVYNEHEFYFKGKDIILEGYNKGLFKKKEDGTLFIDMGHELGEKVLLRKDQTSLYITQDLYLSEQKFKDYKFDKSIIVSGSEQLYHFKVLFSLLELIKAKSAGKNYHLSYGMVYLPEGRMKSREGKILDADNILKEMTDTSQKELEKRYKNLGKKEKAKRAKQIGFGALVFHILKFDPQRDINFNPEESLSFEGDTGPYIQYANARINSIFKKIKNKKFKVYEDEFNEDEFELIKILGSYPNVVREAAENYKPSLIANYLLLLVKKFNDNYRKYSILKSKTKLKESRLSLALATHYILKDGLRLLFIGTPEEM
ncbi:arginine--tRNA ligase [Candidatus Woesearchaeota archaeon]|nr:arginine--tRNA ligase [Candidatus Woesearchaeota archaeon]